MGDIGVLLLESCQSLLLGLLGVAGAQRLLLLIFPGVILCYNSSMDETEIIESPLSDEDEGVAEALRRDAELDADPSQGISLAQLDSQIHGQRV